MNEQAPWQQLTQMITGYWTSRAIYVAAKFRIADRLADGPRAAEELAAAAGVAAGPLYRVLRALAGAGVFAQQADGRFQLNPLAEPLREGGATFVFFHGAIGMLPEGRVQAVVAAPPSAWPVSAAGVCRLPPGMIFREK